MDKIISKIIALGIPGLVLLMVVASGGLAGGAALVAALAVLGGPLGMAGGIVALGLLVLIANAISEYGFEALYERTVAGLRAKGVSDADILRAIDKYPISRALKLSLKETVRNNGRS